MNLARSVKRFLADKGIKVTRKPKVTGKTSFFNEELIIAKLLKSIPNHSRYVIDIAAADGLWLSNTYSLYNQGYAGICVEYDPERFARLADWYQFYEDVCLLRTKATPLNILELLHTCECPQEFGVLNLDIDSYDHHILARMLTAYRPQVMCVEINESMPVPVKFTVDYDPEHYWKNDRFMGQSLSMLHELCQKHNYDLVEVEYNNAFYVAREHNTFPALEPAAAFKTGFLDKTDRVGIFINNGPYEKVYSMTPEEVVTFYKELFDQKYKGKYTLGL